MDTKPKPDVRPLDDMVIRQKLINKIERFFVGLESMPYHSISTSDLQTIYNKLYLGNEE